ncbi:MAG: hypothetical protein ACRD6X_19785, partial [Pyrinomonadaceae bacterium]
MKQCPKCITTYADDTLNFCLEDGEWLKEVSANDEPATGRQEMGDASLENEPQTAILSEPGAIATGFRSEPPASTGDLLHSELPTRAQILTTDQTAILQTGAEAEPQRNLGDSTERPSLSAHRAAKPLVAVGLAVILLVGGFFGYRYFSPTKQIESIAVMPFVNESGNADVEYLSDGMTETLISSLSQLPNLN